MAMVTPFDVFKVTEITDAINLIPNKYGRLQQMGIMPDRNVPTRTIGIEEKHGILTLLPVNTQNVGRSGQRKMRILEIPRITYDDYVSPDDVQDARKMGGNDLESLSALLNDRLADARAKHDITLEWHRVGALQGIIRDADGSPIYNLYDEFNVSPVVKGMGLSSNTTKVRNKCLAAKRTVEQNLLGDVSRGVHALCSPEFFEALISHPSVEAAYANWSAAGERIAGDVRGGFPFGGITFEEYNASAVSPAGDIHRFIPEGKAIAFPTGTAQTFRTYFGPSDFNEDVNRRGRRYYAKVKPHEDDRGYKILTQSSPLPLCLRPQALVTLEI